MSKMYIGAKEICKRMGGERPISHRRLVEMIEKEGFPAQKRQPGQETSPFETCEDAIIKWCAEKFIKK